MKCRKRRKCRVPWSLLVCASGRIIAASRFDVHLMPLRSTSQCDGAGINLAGGYMCQNTRHNMQCLLLYWCRAWHLKRVRFEMNLWTMYLDCILVLDEGDISNGRYTMIWLHPCHIISYIQGTIPTSLGTSWAATAAMLLLYERCREAWEWLNSTCGPTQTKMTSLFFTGGTKTSPFSRSSCSLVLTPFEVIISVRMLSLSRLTES